MLSLIVAIAEDNAIGMDNTMPWHLPDDLKYFKRVTEGKTIIMGRKTLESLPGILPGRKHIVLTSCEDFTVENKNPAASAVEIRCDAEAILKEYRERTEESFIIGGACIYKMALPFCEKLYLTRILEHFEADTFFPDFNENDYFLLSSTDVFTDEKTGIKYRFDVFEKK